MSRRTGLGRGLDALLPSQARTVDLERDAAFKEVAIDDITPNPRQPRAIFDEDSIEQLASSIRELGILQPLLVRAHGGAYELVAGERRVRAARRAGLTRVPVMIVETDDAGSLQRALVENIHRSQLNPIEEAAAYRQLIEEGGLTQEGLAQRLGVNRVTVTNALRLLELPTTLQRLLVDGRLTAGHGRALLRLQGNPFQERLGKRAAQEGLSVREIEDLARRYEGITRQRSGARAESGDLPEIIREAQRRLADHLQTRVRVEGGRKKGRVVVDFATLDELQRLLETIVGDRSPAATRFSPQPGAGERPD